MVRDALEKITPQAPDIWAQVHHAVREEWALTVEDVVRRRTTLGIRGLDTPPVRARVSRILESRECRLRPVISGTTSLEIVRCT
jgi:glycerol-3-phosphate dehydrogenase